MTITVFIGISRFAGLKFNFAGNTAFESILVMLAGGWMGYQIKKTEKEDASVGT